MQIDDKMVGLIAERVRSVADPDKVVLFGSVARGTATRDSDIDLLVLKAEVSNPRKESVRIRRALRGLGRAFDVIVMRSQWYEGTKDIPGSLASCAALDGKIIYAS